VLRGSQTPLDLIVDVDSDGYAAVVVRSLVARPPRNDRGEQIGAPELARRSVFQIRSFVQGFRFVDRDAIGPPTR
jgi:hypothetical protein